VVVVVVVGVVVVGVVVEPVEVVVEPVEVVVDAVVVQVPPPAPQGFPFAEAACGNNVAPAKPAAATSRLATE
jgi:hypothetical protein